MLLAANDDSINLLIYTFFAYAVEVQKKKKTHTQTVA